MRSSELKRRVTKFFKARKLMLKPLAGGRIAADDDFFELYVLHEFVANAPRPVTPRATDGGRFRVATSPSPYWRHGSYFEFSSPSGHRMGLRTGLQVEDRYGDRAELDVLIVELASEVEPETVKCTMVKAAAECKRLKRNVTIPLANQVLGIAYRVWRLPVPTLASSPCLVVVHHGISDIARKVLTRQSIGDLNAKEKPGCVAEHAQAVMRAL